MVPPRPTTAAFVMLALLTACDAKAPRDTSGQAMQLTPVKLAGPSDFPIDLAAFLPEGGFGDATRSVRDNGLAHVDQISYRGTAALTYQSFRDGRILGPNDYAEIASRRDFERRLESAGIPYRSPGGEIAPVRHPRYPSVGFTYAGPGAAPGSTCFVGRAAYGVRVQSSETLGLGTADGVLSGGLCGPRLDAERWVRLFNGMTATAP